MSNATAKADFDRKLAYDHFMPKQTLHALVDSGEC